MQLQCYQQRVHISCGKLGLLDTPQREIRASNPTIVEAKFVFGFARKTRQETNSRGSPKIDAIESRVRKFVHICPHSLSTDRRARLPSSHV
jgi:hypothetical protein